MCKVKFLSIGKLYDSMKERCKNCSHTFHLYSQIIHVMSNVVMLDYTMATHQQVDLREWILPDKYASLNGDLHQVSSLKSVPVRRAVTMHQPGWQQLWWNGIHCTLSWHWGGVALGRHYICHNAPVETVEDFAVATLNHSRACWGWPAAIQRKHSKLFGGRERSFYLSILGSELEENHHHFCVSWKHHVAILVT